MNVRRAREPEAAMIHKLLTLAFQEYDWAHTNRAALSDAVYTPELLKDRMRRGAVFVAELDDELVGTVAGIAERECLCVKSLAVLPAYRGKVIAKRLMENVEAYARGSGCRKTWLTVAPMMGKLSGG